MRLLKELTGIINRTRFIGGNEIIKSQKFVQRSNFLALFIMALVPVFVPVFFMVGAPWQAAMLVGVFFNSYLVLLLNKRYESKAGRILQNISLLVWLFYFSLVFGKESSAHFLYLAFSLVPFAQFKRSDWLIPLLSVFGFLLAFWAIEFQWVAIDTILGSSEQKILHSIVITLVFVWVVVNFWFYNRSTEIYEENLQQALRKVDAKNREMEQFVYIASHDLQEPLRTIDSFAQLCLSEEDKTQEDEELYLKNILSSAGRMNAQIRALMNLSRIGGMSDDYKKHLDTSHLVEEAVADLSQAIKESGASVEFEDLPVVNGYEIELRLLFQNLLSNALKFRDNGRVPHIKIRGTEQQEYWQFSVGDNGIGIDDYFKEKVFTIFQRLNPRNMYSGEGIGLAHCKKIVELHGGSIWFESRPGAGTTFYFTISKKKHE